MKVRIAATNDGCAAPSRVRHAGRAAGQADVRPDSDASNGPAGADVRARVRPGIVSKYLQNDLPRVM